MKRAHLASVDLNLLVALDALLSEGHVTRAAARVGVSQSAMSHSLARLRELFGDPLFVRSPRGMLPTPRAAGLAAPLRQILGDIAKTLEDDAPFDPRTVERRFTVGMVDYVEIVLLPQLLARLSRVAPRVELAVRPLPARVEGALESDALDLVLGMPLPPSNRIFAQRLFEDRFVSLARRRHPDVKRAMTLEQFVALPHLFISLDGTPGGPVDDALAKVGHKRRIALTVPHFLVAPILVAESDLVLTLPERVARKFERPFSLRVFEPPVELERFSIWQVWHERHNADPAHTWFRNVASECARVGSRAPSARRRD